MDEQETRFNLGRALAAGAIAGLVFAGFEMLAALTLSGPGAVFTPLRMIGAMALGPQALDPQYSLVAASAAGLVLHLALSMIFAVIFESLVPVGLRTSAVVRLGMFYGFMLWLTNYYLLGPALGWVWFAQQTMPVVEAVAHSVFFGAVIAWVLHYGLAQVDTDNDSWAVAEAEDDVEHAHPRPSH